MGMFCGSPDVLIVVPSDRQIVPTVRQPNSLTACWVNGSHDAKSMRKTE